MTAEHMRKSFFFTGSFREIANFVFIVLGFLVLLRLQYAEKVWKIARPAANLKLKK